jgi:tetratricopeptide (TPR) repeat protein
MFSDLLALKEWKTDNIADFYNRLTIFPNEDKCDYTVSVANELIKKNNIQYYKVAEEILINAIRNYFNVEDLNYKAKIYFCLGYLYEVQKKYINSFTYYEKYKLNNNIYEGANSILLKIIILRDNFKYSEELEKLFLEASGEYNLVLRNDRIYEDIAEYLILLNKNNFEKAEEKKKDLKALVKYGQLPLLDVIIRKDSIFNALSVPDKVIKFVEKI